MKFKKRFKILVTKLAAQFEHIVRDVRAFKVEHAIRSTKDLLGINESADNSVEGQAKVFRIWVLVSGFTLLICALSTKGTPNDEQRKTANELTNGLTDIPDGMVLVPIRATNFDALDPVLGSSAWVDLYLPGLDGKRSIRIAESVPLIRAPKNRQQLAIVLPENDETTVRAIADQVTIALRNGPKKRRQPTESRVPQGSAKNSVQRRSGRTKGPLKRESRPALRLTNEPGVENEA